MRLLKEMQSTPKWEKLRDELEDKCQPYIKHLKGCNSLLIRGSKQKIKYYSKFTTRQDRIPRLIDDRDLHKMMDNWTQKNWGFKARSQSVFTSTREHNAKMYGKPYIMFPIGKFDYAWNDNVYGLYGAYDRWGYIVEIVWDDLEDTRDTDDRPKYDEDEAKEEAFDLHILPHLENYDTNNLSKLLKKGESMAGYTECIVHCKTYYMIHPEWRQLLVEWFGKRYWNQ